MKKGMLSALALVVLLAGLLGGVSSSAAGKPAAHAKQPAAHAKQPANHAKPRAYRHYVACGYSPKARPTHSCPVRSRKAAFFKSRRADVTYKVCIRSPGHRHRCTKEPQEAKRGTLYFNEITAPVRGRYRVTWFVKGKRVGAVGFRVR